MRELDLILQTFLTEHYEQLNDEEKSTFVALLDLQDPVLYGWLMGRSEPIQSDFKSMITRIREVIRT